MRCGGGLGLGLRKEWQLCLELPWRVYLKSTVLRCNYVLLFMHYRMNDMKLIEEFCELSFRMMRRWNELWQDDSYMIWQMKVSLHSFILLAKNPAPFLPLSILFKDSLCSTC